MAQVVWWLLVVQDQEVCDEIHAAGDRFAEMVRTAIANAEAPPGE